MEAETPNLSCEFFYNIYDFTKGRETARFIGAYIRGDRYIFHHPVSTEPEPLDFGCYLIPSQRAGLFYPVAWAKNTGELRNDWTALLSMLSSSLEITEEFAFKAGELPNGGGVVWTGRFAPRESRLVEISCTPQA